MSQARTGASQQRSVHPAEEPVTLEVDREEEILKEQLFEGLKEALEEAKKATSVGQVESKYDELMENLLESMPDRRALLVQELDRAFMEVFKRPPRVRSGSRSASANVITIDDEIITPGAAYQYDSHQQQQQQGSNQVATYNNFPPQNNVQHPNVIAPSSMVVPPQPQQQQGFHIPNLGQVHVMPQQQPMQGGYQVTISN